MAEDIPPPIRPYRIRRPSTSIISSTTSPIFPAPQSSSLGSARSSTSQINTHRDIDEDIQPSSSTSSFVPSRQRLGQNYHFSASSSSSATGRSSSPLGSPDSTFWAPSPVNSSFRRSGSVGPPTPGGNCVVSSSTMDDVPPSPFSPEENISGNLMLPPMSANSNNNGGIAAASNSVSVISGSGNYNSNNDSSDLSGSSSSWNSTASVYERTGASSASTASSSLAGNSFSTLVRNSFLGGSSIFSTSSASTSTQHQENDAYSSSSSTVSSLSAVRSKIKKASSFERFSAQAQASSNTNNNNSSGNNSANLNCTSSITTTTATTTIVSNSSSISFVPASTSVVTGAAGSTSRLFWDHVPSSSSFSAGVSTSASSSCSTSGGSGSLISSLGDSLTSTKPFHLKKFAAKIASVFEQEQLNESVASLTSASQSRLQVQQSAANNIIRNICTENSNVKNNQDSLVGMGLTQPRDSNHSPLNLTDGMVSASNLSSIPQKGKNSSVPPKSFLGKNIPLTPKQKLLQRLQSGELFNSFSPSPPPPQIQPSTPVPTVVPISQQSAIQQQHQILLSSLQQPPSSILSDPLHISHQQPLSEEGNTPTPPPLSPCTSPTPRASAELERYVNSMSLSNYEAFIRASGDDFIVQDSLGKHIDPGDLSNIQVLYDAADPYTYYYGNILVDEMDFTSSSSNIVSGTSGISGSSTSSGRPLLLMPSNPGVLDDSSFQGQQQLQQGHGHLEFVLGMNPQDDQQRQHELREEDLQLGDISHHQSFLDPNDNGLSLTSGKSQAESTLRNLLLMEPLRAHDDSWVSAATAAEYQNRLGLGLGGLGVRGINLIPNEGNNSSLSLNSSWINDWQPRANSWQQPHQDIADNEEQNEVMDMSILDMTDKGHGKRQGHSHSQGHASGLSMEESELISENSTGSGLSLLTPMDLQQPLGLSLTIGKTSEGPEPIDLQHPHPHSHQHSHRVHIEGQDSDDEPVNLMAVVNLEHELQQQVESQNHQSQQDLGQSQMQNSNSIYSSVGRYISSTVPPKVLSPPSTTYSFDVISQAETLEERKMILVKKCKENDSMGSGLKQQSFILSNALSPSSASLSGTPGPATNVILDKPVQPRSYASLPSLLCLSRITENGWTIVTNRNKIIAPNTRFGPVEGPLRKVYQEDLDTTDAVYPCLIMVDSTNTFWQLDRNDELCNWMKFVRMAHSSSAQNLLISEINSVLYFTTCKHIAPKAELQAGYDFDYAQRYGLQYLNPTLSDEELLEADMAVEDTVNTYVCHECELDFLSEEEFNVHHQNTHCEPEIQPKKKAAIKKYLNSKFPNSENRSNLFETPTKVHKNRKLDSPVLNLTDSVLCKSCGVIYLSLDELNKHLKESVSCGLTGTVDISILKAKENVDIPGEEKENKNKSPKVVTPKSKCTICYKAFATRDRLDRHMLVHNGEELKPLQCNFCVKRFLTNSALAGHVKTHAEEGKCFECPMCSFATQQLLQLKEHVQSHKNKENGMFYCPHCVKRFTLYSMVRKHIRAFHGPRQFACEHCPMSFPSSDKLKLHKLKHSDHREFLCAECGRQFKRKDKLREHAKRMHENKKRVVPVTPEVLHNVPTKKEKLLKKFNPKVSQEEFSRFIYKCMDCMLGFKRRGMLVNHLAKRHPDKPPQQVPELNLPILRPARNYFCPYCDRIYKSSSKRKSHILKSHPGKQVPPQLRGKEIITATKQKSAKGDNLPVITVRMSGNSHTPSVELFSLQPQNLMVTTTSAMTAVDDNGVSGNVVVSTRRDPVIASPHGCQWCHRQYATRAKLLQHQRKSHLHLMPPEIQTPRTQKNNVTRSLDTSLSGIIAVSVTDVAPIHAQSLNLINSSNHTYSTLDREMIGSHSEKSGSQDVIGFLLTTTTVTNGDFENAIEPEIVMMSSLPQAHCQTNSLTNCTSTGLTTVPDSANDLPHQNIVNVNHVISSTGFNLNLNPILTKTDD